MSKRYKRVMLLSLRDGELGCWQGWNGVAVVKRGAVSFPLSALPCFERVMSERSCYLGPIATRSELNSAATAAAVRGMARAWAGEAALSLVACPLALRERAVLLMVCDDGPGEPASMERQFLATVKHEAEKALERAILKRKRQVIRK